ncbi:MAG: cupin domain-containing protein [Pseudomonadales bacterium]|nr:cupin domain-containing protein [Pseudomonadales bacterium]
MSQRLLPASFDARRFLREYWQKKPLLIRGDGHFQDPLGRDDILELACEDLVESRLIRSDAHRQHWQLRHGPFTAKALTALPREHWSLLIQGADQWHEGVRELLREFDFIPRWRIDDVMISLAAEGGGVGPHFDYYDVFLVQGLGKKRWRLGGRADSNSALLPDTELRLLQHFETQEDWIVEPGDILYIPPNIAHYGVAIGDSVTYSVGFRAPSAAELLDEFCAELLPTLPEETRYTDTTARLPEQPGEISSEVSGQLRDMFQELLQNPLPLTRSFARFMTRPKYPELFEDDLDASAQSLAADLQEGAVLQRHPSSRFAFHRHPQGCELYADGESFTCPAGLAAHLPALCDPFAPELPWAALISEDESHAQLIVALYNQGSLWIADDEEQEEDDA